MLLLALAIAPGLAICIFVFYRDAYDKEPAVNLFLAFVYGMLTIIPAAILELATHRLTDNSIAGIVFSSFVLVALVEEFFKFLALRYYGFNRRSFDEPFDGIVYGVMVSMGFATVENIFYVTQYGMSTALMRIFTAVPAHASFGVIMGYYVGKAKFDYLKKQQLLLKGLFVATLAHGFYDCFLFLIQNEWIHRYISKGLADILLFAGAIASLVISVVFSRRLVRVHRRTSAQLYSTNSVLTIRHANAGDVEMIRALAMQIWPDTYAKILSPQQIRYMMNMMYSEQSLLSQMKTNHQFIIVYNAGVPIGFASYSEKAPAIYKLHKIYLKPRQQGRGSGRFVIEQIINDIKPKGAEILQLDVNRNNQAKGFYEKMGFEVVGEKNTDIGNGFLMEDYVMERTL